MEWWVVYVAVGAVAGLLAGLLGVGGGVVVVPSLALAFTAQGVAPGYVMPLALGTSLATIVLTAPASIRAHQAHGAVNWGVVARLAPGLVLGALVGASIATRLSFNALTMMVGMVLWGVSAHLVFNGGFDRVPPQTRSLPGRWALFAAGGAIGLVSSVVGMGGGTLSVPFLTWCRIRLHQAIGTAAAAGFPIALAGSLGYALNGLGLPGLPSLSVGFVDLPALATVALPSVFMAPAGAHLAHRLPTRRLRTVFAAVLFLVGGKLLYQAF